MSTALWLAVLVGAAPQQPSLTIYNDGFAVVRERVPLDLAAGVNTVVYAGATRTLEPDSVVLRDPAGRVQLHVVEQGYRRETASDTLLFSLCEGKVIDFVVGTNPDGSERMVKGKVLRAGSFPNPYGAQNSAGSPIIEV